MALRKPLKVEVLEELHARLIALRDRSLAIGWQPADVFEAAFFFGLPFVEKEVAAKERELANFRASQEAARHLHEAPAGA